MSPLMMGHTWHLQSSQDGEGTARIAQASESLSASGRGMVLVPLDPHDPVSRLSHVAKESQATCLVTKDWGDAKTLGFPSL